MTLLAAFVREERVRTARARVILAELARQALPVLVTGRRSGAHPMADALVSPDPSSLGCWRVTWFHGDAPDGHVEAPTLYAGLVLAWRTGATLRQVTAEIVAPVAKHPGDCGACDVDEPCAECATAYGMADMAEGEERMREEAA